VGDLAILADLQTCDTRLSQLRHRSGNLPEVIELAAIEEDVSDAKEKLTHLESEISQIKKEQKRLEHEVISLETKIAKSNDALYGGGLTSPKEAEALQDEIKSVQRRQTIVEDQIIELMEKEEPIALSFTSGSSAIERLEERREEISGRVLGIQSEIEAEKFEVETERASLVSSVTADLITLYDKQTLRMGGNIAVARLTGTTCGACFLDLSALDLDKIRSADENEITECPECGAFLVK